MKHCIIDVESNGLLEDLTTIHSLVLRDLETGEYVSCCDAGGALHSSIADGLSLLSEAEIVFGHNAITFDLPALKKVYGFELSKDVRVFDTLVACRTRFVHIRETDFALFRQGTLPGKYIGTHKLAAWGYRLGMLKGEYGETTDWKEWTPEMQEYCERDTNVTRLLIKHIRKYGYSKRSVDIEHELAHYLFEMERGGWPFDVEKAMALHATLSGKREELEQRLRELFGQLTVKNGPPFTPKRDNKALGYKKGVTLQRYKEVDFKPGSRDHVAMALMDRYGWKPTEMNTGDGKVKVDEVVLRGLDYPEIPDLIEYFTVVKRLGALSDGAQAWMKQMTMERPFGGKLTGMMHVHPYVNPGGTVTHRASHSHPNIAQVTKVGNPYGKECRELFTVPPGWKLVGGDMSGLELRCLAHYMARWDDGKYGDVILEGDIHDANAILLGLARDKTKTWFYAYLYGAGDPKLGRVADPSLKPRKQKERGEKDRTKFEGGLPALRYLIEALKKRVEEDGWIKLIDNRRAYVRHEHAVLNTLLQGTGAVLCKFWIVTLMDALTHHLGPMGWDKEWQAVGWIHDELQVACKEAHAPLVEKLMVQTAESMTKLFMFRIPLTGEAKTGDNWSETH